MQDVIVQYAIHVGDARVLVPALLADHPSAGRGHMDELALFAGAGGGVLAGHLLGWRTVCAVELNAYCRRVLLNRQRDGLLDPFPIWDDIHTFDGRPWRGHIEVITGGLASVCLRGKQSEPAYRWPRHRYRRTYRPGVWCPMVRAGSSARRRASPTRPDVDTCPRRLQWITGTCPNRR
jgi:hypothetical protein